VSKRWAPARSRRSKHRQATTAAPTLIAIITAAPLPGNDRAGTSPMYANASPAALRFLVAGDDLRAGEQADGEHEEQKAEAEIVLGAEDRAPSRA
jgi:hypothetical protein